jgi:hypothetical protein
MLIEYTVVRQLMVVCSLCFCQWYARLIFGLSFSLVRYSTVGMDFIDTLVTTIGFGIGVWLEMQPGVFEQLEVMGFAFSKVRTNNLPVFLVDC